MMKQEAIVQTLFISLIGQRVYFQMQLPHDTNRIVGLEYGAIKTAGVPIINMVLNNGAEFQMPSGKLIGRLALQIPGNEGVFCQVDCMEDRNMAGSELYIANQWQPTIFTHKRKNEELALNVSANAAFVEGYFVDSWGIGAYLSLEYTFHLYLWIEKCVP